MENQNETLKKKSFTFQDKILKSKKTIQEPKQVAILSDTPRARQTSNWVEDIQ